MTRLGGASGALRAGAIAGAFLCLATACERTQEDRGALGEVRAAIDTAVAHHPGISPINDQEAVGIIAIVNNTTIEMSQLAEQRATRGSLRELARWLLNEHDRLNTRTRQTADSLNLEPVPGSLPVLETRDEVLRNLRQMPRGAEWDRMYVAAVTELHETALEPLRAAQGTMRYLSVDDRVLETVRMLEASLTRMRAEAGTESGG